MLPTITLLLALSPAAQAQDPGPPLCVRPGIVGLRQKLGQVTWKEYEGREVSVPRVDGLRRLYVAVTLDEACDADNGVVTVRARDGGELRSVGEAYLPVGDHLRDRTIRTSATLYDVLTTTEAARMAQLRAGELGDGATFDDNVVFAWCEQTGDSASRRSKVVACPDKLPEGTVRRTSNLAFSASVGRDHQYLSLAVVAQPGRFMGVMVPCSLAQTYTAGAVPEACEGGAGNTWAATAAASPIGAKLYLSPSIRYPWVGFSLTVSASSLGVSSVLGSLIDNAADAQGDGTQRSGLFASPLDVALGIGDLRLPGDARFDITPQVGLAVLSRDGALRPAPFFGVSMTTPLIEVYGSRYNGVGRGAVELRPDSPAAKPAADALTKLEDAVTDLGGDRPWTGADWSEDDVGAKLDALASALKVARAQLDALGDEAPHEQTRKLTQLAASAEEPLQALADRRAAAEDALDAADEEVARAAAVKDDQGAPADPDAEVVSRARDAVAHLGAAATEPLTRRAAALPEAPGGTP